MESDAHFESQLTRCALWGRRFTSLGLLPFLEGAASRLLVPVSASYVLSSYHGGGWGAGCNNGGHLDGKATLLRHRCSQSRAAPCPWPQPGVRCPETEEPSLSVSEWGEGGVGVACGAQGPRGPPCHPTGKPEGICARGGKSQCPPTVRTKQWAAQLSCIVTEPTGQGVGEDTEDQIRKGPCTWSWAGVGAWQSQPEHLNTPGFA